MDGLFFLSSVVGIGLVMWWLAQNDRVAADKPTRGLFAMATRTVAVRKSRRWTAAGETPSKPAPPPP